MHLHSVGQLLHGLALGLRAPHKLGEHLGKLLLLGGSQLRLQLQPDQLPALGPGLV